MKINKNSHPTALWKIVVLKSFTEFPLKIVVEPNFINPTNVMGDPIDPPLLIYLSSHENQFYTNPDAPGLLIKFIWAHIIHAAKTF